VVFRVLGKKIKIATSPCAVTHDVVQFDHPVYLEYYNVVV
jgi:hypothetical protein